MAAFELNGADAFARELLANATQLDASLPLVVGKIAVDLNGRVQQNASGRPGPNAPTGDYRGSWRVEDEDSDPTTVSKSVGTDRPQARRLEYGFVGTDSIGRTYNQPPYPHMGPAVDAVEPTWRAAMDAVHKKATGD